MGQKFKINAISIFLINGMFRNVFLKYLHNNSNTKDDETLPNFIKRKHPSKGEKKKQEARTKSPDIL